MPTFSQALSNMTYQGWNGMGNPDLPPPQHVIDKLVEVARKPDAHGYSQSKGIPGLRRAQANYYARRFGVEVDPETEVIVTMGSKEGLASLATAITAKKRGRSRAISMGRPIVR